MITATPASTEGPLVHNETKGGVLHSLRMAVLGEHVSGIVHDFRNVLQTVIASLELIENRANNPAEVQRVAASALHASELGIGLSNRLLAFSRFETIKAKSVSVLPSLESAAETLSRTAGARIDVCFNVRSATLWPVVIDPAELELALINLGINARDAMPNGGRLQFDAANRTIPETDRRVAPSSGNQHSSDRRGPPLRLHGGEYVALTVADTGMGMDATTLAQAAKPFFTTKVSGKGTGLGLAMVHTLTNEGRGALRLISTPGRGTRVEIWLPRASGSRKGGC